MVSLTIVGVVFANNHANNHAYNYADLYTNVYCNYYTRRDSFRSCSSK